MKFRAALLLLALSSCAYLRPLFRGPAPKEPPAPAAELPAPTLDAPTLSAGQWVDGRALRALSVALGALVELRRWQLAGEAAPAEVAICLARPDAYDVQLVREDADRWVVYVGPRPERCSDGRLLGGDATYEVSKADYSLISVQFGE